jgi:hypothetical protein
MVCPVAAAAAAMLAGVISHPSGRGRDRSQPAARVATQTVYASTGGKAAVFAELLQPAINDQTAAEAVTAARQAMDPERVLALCATAARSGQERYWDIVYGLMRRPPEDELAQRAVANVAAKCMEALTVIAQRLNELGALKSGISPSRGADMLWFYFGPNAWYSLVGDRGWTFDQAEDLRPGRAMAAGSRPPRPSRFTRLMCPWDALPVLPVACPVRRSGAPGSVTGGRRGWRAAARPGRR